MVYGTSTFMGYLMPNIVYTYILCIWFVTEKFIKLYLNEPELICLHTVKLFQVLLFKPYNYIWAIDRTLTSTTIPAQSGLGSNGNEDILYIPQSSRTGASASHSLLSYPGHTVAVGWGDLNPLERFSRRSLQPHPFGLPEVG